MPQEPKKPWVEPELVVISRGKTEEAVLTVCKAGNMAGGPIFLDIGCDKVPTCLPCNAQAPS